MGKIKQMSLCLHFNTQVGLVLFRKLKVSLHPKTSDFLATVLDIYTTNEADCASRRLFFILSEGGDCFS